MLIDPSGQLKFLSFCTFFEALIGFNKEATIDVIWVPDLIERIKDLSEYAQNEIDLYFMDFIKFLSFWDL